MLESRLDGGHSASLFSVPITEEEEGKYKLKSKFPTIIVPYYRSLWLRFARLRLCCASMTPNLPE